MSIPVTKVALFRALNIVASDCSCKALVVNDIYINILIILGMNIDYK